MAKDNLNESINTFEKGMDRDSSNQNKPQGTYEFAENLINNSDEGKYLLTPENGIVETNTLTDTENIENPKEWITIGNVYIDNVEVLFQGYVVTPFTTFTNSRIALKNIITGDFTVIYTSHSKLNFNINYHINNPQAKKIYNGDINLYFTDNFNPPRFLRLVYSSDLSGNPYIVNQEVANLTQDFEEPIIDFTSITEGGGNAPIGSIHFFIQYLDKYGNSTRYSNLTNGIPIVQSNREGVDLSNSFKFTTNYNPSPTITEVKIPNAKLITGNIADTPLSVVTTSKQVTITIDHLDTAYTYYKVGYMFYTGNVYTPTYKLITTLNAIDASSGLSHIDGIVKTVTFFEPTTGISDEDIIQISKTFEYTQAKTMTQNQNYLILGNLRNSFEEVSDSVYENICNNVTVRFKPKTLVTNTSDTYDSTDLGKAYDHEQSCFRFKGYKRTEVYSVGFRFIFKGGYKTKAFHIPARHRGVDYVNDYNSSIYYYKPNTGDNVTGTYYSQEVYKEGSPYITSDSNAKIRHHVMPDWYHNDGTAQSYRLGTVSFLASSSTEVSALGIYFEDIDVTSLPEAVKANLVGIEIVRQTREDVNNKRVLCQGITRLMQRPLSTRGSYPVSYNGTAFVPLTTDTPTKTLAWALTNQRDNYTGQIDVDDSSSYWNWSTITDEVRAYLRNDGLAPYSGGKYGSTGKVLGYLGGAGDNSFIYPSGAYDKQHTNGQILTGTNSFTAPLESFGKIRNFSNTTTGKSFESYEEFVLNIISPETEFNQINLPNSVKLELRDKLYFYTLDKKQGESLFVFIDHTVGYIDYNISDTGSGSYIRGNTNANGGGAGFRYFRVDEDKRSHILVAYPLKSEELGFTTDLNVEQSNTITTYSQGITDLNSSFKSTDPATSREIEYKYLIKHAFVSDGLYVIPNDSTYATLNTFLKTAVNNNLTFDLRESYFDLNQMAHFEQSFVDYKIVNENGTSNISYGSCTDSQKADIDYSSTPVFDVINDLTAQYGSIYTAEYFPLGVYYDTISTSASFNIGTSTSQIFSGDTFVTWYGSNNGGAASTHNVAYSNNPFPTEDEHWFNICNSYVVNHMYFPVETSINTQMRNFDTTNGVKYFLHDNPEDEYSSGPVYNIYTTRSPAFNSDNYLLSVGKNQNNINLSTSSNQLTTGGSLGSYPNRMIYSFQSVDGEIDDRFRQFDTDNYKDIPKDTGEIWNLYTMNNDVYAHTENALWKTYMLQTTGIVAEDNSTFVLGQANLFGLPAQKLLTKQGASGGTMSSWGFLLTPYGLIFIDNNGNKLYKCVNDQLEEISFNGMMNFFNHNTKFLTRRGDYRNKSHYLDDTPFNPYNGHGWLFGWDDFNKRVLITKRSGINNTTEQKSDSLRFKNDKNEYFNEFTLSFSFLTNNFLGFHTFKPIYYLNSGRYLMTTPDPSKYTLVSGTNNFIGTHSDSTNPCKFYTGEAEDSKLTYNVNEFPMYEKVYDNIVLDMYNYRQIVDSTNSYLKQSKTLIPNRGTTVKTSCTDEQYDLLEVETSNQYSGEIQLMYNHNTTDHYKYYNDFRRGVKYYNKQYRIALPKARTDNVLIDRDNLRNYSTGRFGYDKLGDRFKDKYAKITITWRNYEKFNFILNFIKNIFRINYR